MTVAALEKPVEQGIPWRELLHPTLIVAALGYFVDIYDMILFNVVRRDSLQDLGYLQDALLEKGILLMNLQMAGMLLGGLFWGMLGDKKGRLSVLFGSIVIYSIANILNAGVHSIESYAFLRFVAGFGLAGELGAAVTLVSEVVSPRARGYATGLISVSGALGATASALINDFVPWRSAYFVGGIMGLLLLAMRIKTMDSDLFHLIANKAKVKRGDLRMLLQPKRLKIFMSLIIVGSPIWLTAGILAPFSPEIARELGASGEVKTSWSMFASSAGILLGDVFYSCLSQKWQSRQRVVRTALIGCSAAVATYLWTFGASPFVYYALMLSIGFSIGYWAVLITSAAEQFGTNLRATVTTTVPNFVRATVIPMTLALEGLKSMLGLRHALIVVSVLVMVLAMVAARALRESFFNKLDFIES